MVVNLIEEVKQWYNTHGTITVLFCEGGKHRHTHAHADTRTHTLPPLTSSKKQLFMTAVIIFMGVICVSVCVFYD